MVCSNSSPTEEVISGTFGNERGHPWSRNFIRIVNWNIERGHQFSAILDFLRTAEADVLLLQEVDLHVRRTQFRDVACELARSLHLNYVFGKEFQELDAGSWDLPAYHGSATLSPWPLVNSRIIRFQRQSNFWKPHWYIPETARFQRRLGGRIALVSEALVDGRSLVTYNLHLESKGKDSLRLEQLRETLEDTNRPTDASLTIVGGDFNMNLRNGDAASILHSAGFRDAVRLPQTTTVPARRPFEHGHTIDWIYISQEIRSQGQVHASVRASDHYPVSVTFPLDAVPAL